MSSYWSQINELDIGILFFGAVLILSQIYLLFAWTVSIYWSVKRTRYWLDWFVRFSELFPLAGICGTVLGLLNTFNTIGAEGMPDITTIIPAFAPAMTSTISGIIALFSNLALYIVLSAIIREEETPTEENKIPLAEEKAALEKEKG